MKLITLLVQNTNHKMICHAKFFMEVSEFNLCMKFRKQIRST